MGPSPSYYITATAAQQGYIYIPPCVALCKKCCATVLRSVALSYETGKKVLRGVRNRGVALIQLWDGDIMSRGLHGSNLESATGRESVAEVLRNSETRSAQDKKGVGLTTERAGGREMREIKFRGKAKSDGRWLYGSNQVSASEQAHPQGIFPLSGFWDLVDRGSIDPETVGQFTGLHDKNGKEIYEGDYVMPKLCPPGDDISANPDKVATPRLVCWNRGNGGWNILPVDGFYEVVGNIHDNPELLEGGQRCLR